MTVDLDDAGFASSVAATETLREHRIRKAIARRVSIDNAARCLADLEDRIHHRVEECRSQRAVPAKRDDVLVGYRKGVIAKRAIERIGYDDVSQEEVLEGVDAILQFVELVLSNIGHGGESPALGGPDGSTPAPSAPHRLSEIEE